MFGRYLPLAGLLAGTTSGGLLLGAALVVAWYALAPLDALRTAAILGVGAVAATGVLWPRARRWLPERACQVASTLMRDSPGRAAFRWGLELGTGVSTFVVTPAMYALLAVAVGQGQPVVVVALCSLYGTSRGAAIAWFAVVYSRRAQAQEHQPGVGLERALRVPLALAIVVAAGLAVP